MRVRRIPLVQAVRELNVHLEEIDTVKQWARHMGYSRSYFSRCIKKHFGRSPRELLAEEKLSRVKEAIKEDPEAICYKIALDADFIDDKALYKFLLTHFDITFTELKQEIL